MWALRFRYGGRADLPERVFWPAAGRLRSGIVEEKLVPVRVVDDEQAIAPLAVRHRRAAGFEIGAGGVHDIEAAIAEGNEQQALAALLRPLAG